MVTKHLKSADLRGKVIDSHVHLGISVKSYASMEFPYAQSLEDHYYRQLCGGVDASIVFPYAPDLYFDPQALVRRGECVPGNPPISPTPYGIENRMVIREIFEYFPELAQRFIPFISFDPGRAVEDQIQAALELERQWPIYGIKIVPVLCQSPVTCLLKEGLPIIEFARERNLPILLHTTPDSSERYSYTPMTFEVVEQNLDVRFCLAHCIGFSRAHLDRANELPNVFVDTAALKIQAQLMHEDCESVPDHEKRFPTNYADHKSVMMDLMRAYPNTLIWGSDAPAYSYFCHRKQGEDYYVDFKLKARYEDEVAALDALPADLRTQASNTNTLRFLFGEE